ncbi:hypothetical protein HU675_0033935 [Bradyrhizobium septentrionale]|uniref:hypothetical protein n=1 Tax=Bradyrhizobium septentrionale TaxID=1404411 RepID=UPI001F1E8F6E|nr:hypothetical protein [Bradyrhizobium septentrionale]UGY22937.1 hypothetical protein HU675_0033935 [Bradyrhizobium septentrionale]
MASAVSRSPSPRNARRDEQPVRLSCIDKFRNFNSSTAIAARSTSMLVASASKSSRGRVSMAHRLPITTPDTLSCAPA